MKKPMQASLTTEVAAVLAPLAIVLSVIALNWALGSTQRKVYPVLGGEVRHAYLGVDCGNAPILDIYRNAGLYCADILVIRTDLMQYSGEDGALIFERHGKWWGTYIEDLKFFDSGPGMSRLP